ncbi:unnamed protein product [Mucor hiemalis]
MSIKNKTEWKPLDPEIVKDTFIQGIRPTPLKLLIKQYRCKNVTEAQIAAIREAEELQEESDSSDTYSHSEDEHRTKEVPRRRSKVELPKTRLKVKQTEEDPLVDELSKGMQKLTLWAEKNTPSNSQVYKSNNAPPATGFKTLICY